MKQDEFQYAKDILSAGLQSLHLEIKINFKWIMKRWSFIFL